MSSLYIYMKSGNVIKLRGIKNWTIRNKGNEITGIEVEYYRHAIFLGYKRLVMNSIDLSQIEAVVRT